jgi:hypothetical protein
MFPLVLPPICKSRDAAPVPQGQGMLKDSEPTKNDGTVHSCTLSKARCEFGSSDLGRQILQKIDIHTRSLVRPIISL